MPDFVGFNVINVSDRFWAVCGPASLAPGEDVMIEFALFSFAVTLGFPRGVITNHNLGAEGVAAAWAKRYGLEQVQVPPRSADGNRATEKRNLNVLRGFAPNFVLVFPGDACADAMIKQAEALDVTVLSVKEMQLAGFGEQPGAEPAVYDA